VPPAALVRACRSLLAVVAMESETARSWWCGIALQVRGLITAVASSHLKLKLNA
jgi:uncharacterized membrane protein